MLLPQGQCDGRGLKAVETKDTDDHSKIQSGRDKRNMQWCQTKSHTLASWLREVWCLPKTIFVADSP